MNSSGTLSLLEDCKEYSVISEIGQMIEMDLPSNFPLTKSCVATYNSAFGDRSTVPFSINKI